jgi:hypothetical protein
LKEKKHKRGERNERKNREKRKKREREEKKVRTELQQNRTQKTYERLDLNLKERTEKAKD